MEARRARLRILGSPAAAALLRVSHRFPSLGVGPGRPALRAVVGRGLSPFVVAAFLWPANLGPPQNLRLAAVKAWHPVTTTVRPFVLRFDPRTARHLWAAHENDLAVPEVLGPLHTLGNRVTFAAGIRAVAVHLVEAGNPDILRGQPGWRIGAYDIEPPARENLVQGGVLAVPAARRSDLSTKRRAIPQHRGQLVSGPLPGGRLGRVDHQDRRRVLPDVVAAEVVDDLRLAHTGRGHEYHPLPPRVADRVHDLAEVFRASCAPAAGLGAALRGEVSIGVRPLAQAEPRRRRQSPQQPRRRPARGRPDVEHDP